MNTFIGIFLAITLTVYGAFFLNGGIMVEKSGQIKTEIDRISATIAYSRIVVEMTAALWMLYNIIVK